MCTKRQNRLNMAIEYGQKTAAFVSRTGNSSSSPTILGEVYCKYLRKIKQKKRERKE
jgi:hypothetical protein